ncbi:hypothetical protein M8J75_002789 [Diaphorina citri]|nr:hypothetical protein M8J75_002789 [Diaphorina citri]
MSQSQQTSTGNRGFARGITTRDHRYLRPTFLYQHGPSSESELSSSDDDRYVPPRTTTVASTALLQSQQDLNATSSLSMTHTSLNTRRDNLNVSTFDHSLSSTPQHDSTSQPSTTSQRNSNMGRMRWTYEHNKNLLYAYYKSTEVDSNKKNYLTRLESIWNSLYPSLPFNGNKLSGQVRSILKRNVFTSHQLESIKTQVRNELSHRQSSQVINTQSTDQSIGDNLAATPQLNLDSPVLNLTMPDPNPDVQIFRQSDNINVDEDQYVEILTKFDSYCQQYEHVEIDKRPIIPKVPYGNKTLQTVSNVNEALKNKFNSSECITQTHNLIYSAAMTVCFLLNLKIGPNDSTRPQTQFNKIPPWKMRLENQIKHLRSKIGTLTHYFKSNCQVSYKVKNKIKEIAYEFKINYWAPDYNERLKVQLELLKQKSAALGYRIRKYNKRKKKFEQNKMFRRNQKKFYQSLNEKKISEYTTLPPTEGLFNFWNELWGHENTPSVPIDLSTVETPSLPNPPDRSTAETPSVPSPTDWSTAETPGLPNPTDLSTVETPSLPNPPDWSTAETPSVPSPTDWSTAETPGLPNPTDLRTVETPSLPNPPDWSTAETPSLPSPTDLSTVETPSLPNPPDRSTAETPSVPSPTDWSTAETPGLPNPTDLSTVETPSLPNPLDRNTTETPSPTDRITEKTSSLPSPTDLSTVETPSLPNPPDRSTAETPSPTDRSTVETPSLPNPTDLSTVETPSLPNPTDLSTVETPSLPNPPDRSTAETPSPTDRSTVETPSLPNPTDLSTVVTPSLPNPTDLNTVETPSLPDPPDRSTAETPSLHSPTDQSTVETPSLPSPTDGITVEPSPTNHGVETQETHLFYFLFNF